MLTKLLKYEFRSTWKTIGAMNLFILLITAAGCFSLIANLWISPTYGMSTFGSLYMVFYYLTIIGISFAVTIFLAVRFYKNLYTDEGYLMHTLPVKQSQLLLSKTITGSVYMLITELIIFGSTFIMVKTYIYHVQPDEYRRIAEEMHQLISGTGISQLPYLLIIFTLTFIVGAFSNTLMPYCAIVVGQLFPRKKVMSSILCYIGIYVILQFTITAVILPIAGISIFSTNNNVSAIFSVTMTTSFIMLIVTSITFYLFSLYLMKRKLNLD